MTAVLFDLDGTLTDREASVRAYAEGFRRNFGARLGELADAALGDALVRCDQWGYNPRRGEDLRAALPWRGAPPGADELQAHWAAHFADWGVLRPDAHAVLDRLRGAGVACAVVTNGGSRSQRRKLERLGLAARIDAAVVSEEVAFEKPDPRIFELALGRVGATAADAWFVGDHPDKDVGGAEALGLCAVWIRSGIPWPAGRPPPRHAVAALGELPALLGR